MISGRLRWTDEIIACILQCILIFGDLERLPFVLESGFGVLRHLTGCIEAHLVLHRLSLIGSCKFTT